MNTDILFLEDFPKKEKRLKMDFTKFHCPVCNKNFSENDDVVVCPECGTPHHRECYKITGKCFNENLHGEENSFAEKYKNSEENKEEKIFKPIEEKSDENKKDSTENPFKTDGKALPDFIRINPAQNHLIEGKHANLFEAAVGKNQNYYIPRFTVLSSLNKGLSLNFIAFFAPLAWSLYRKMYNLSALIFAGYFLFFGLSFYYTYSNTEVVEAIKDCYTEIQKNPELYSDIQFLYEEDTDYLTDAQKNLKEAITTISYPFYMIILSYAVRYVPKIGLSVFGNKIYLKKLCKNIDRAEKKGLSGDELKVYLYKKYGTFPIALAVIVGILEIMIFR